MQKRILFAFMALTLGFLTTKAQTSKYAVGAFSDIMLESPTYKTFYGVTGKYDWNNHAGVQLSVGYSNVHTTIVGGDFIYTLKDKTQRNFNVYGGIGVSGEFYKQKVELDYQGKISKGYAKDSYLGINPTVGLSYHISPIRATVYAGYKVKYYPFEDAADINYLSVGLRYHL